MRPKKIIILACSDDSRASLRRFVLQVWGYRVISCEHVSECLQTVADAPLEGRGSVSAVLTDLEASEAAQLTAQKPPHMPVLSLADGFRPVEIRLALKYLVAARRGPKKHQAVEAALDWRREHMQIERQAA
jgi:hypothetical protein